MAEQSKIQVGTKTASQAFSTPNPSWYNWMVSSEIYFTRPQVELVV